VLVALACSHSFVSAYDFGPWPLLEGVTELPPAVTKVGTSRGNARHAQCSALQARTSRKPRTCCIQDNLLQLFSCGWYMFHTYVCPSLHFWCAPLSAFHRSTQLVCDNFTCCCMPAVSAGAAVHGISVH
jgi:hypothetical protein